MTDDGSLRSALQRELDREPEMRLTVDTVLTAGRRSRAQRHAAAVLASAVAVGAAVAASFVITGGATTPPTYESPTIATSPSDPPPKRTKPIRRPNRGDDLVDAVVDKGGGGIPGLIDGRVTVHLPGVQVDDRTVLSTTWGDGRIPWEREPFATEWQVSYGESYGGEHILTVWPRFSPTTPRDPDEHCASVPNAVSCDVRGRSDGTTVVTQESFERDSRQWSRAVWHLRDDRFTVGVIEEVRVASLTDARRTWRWSIGQLVALATDPKLIMPEPAVWPERTDTDPSDMQLPS